MAANETFQQLVQKLYTSNLHFHLSETPFSAQILIRKRFLRDKCGPSSIPSVSEEVSKLNDQIFELQKQIQKSCDDKDILENKLVEAEARAKKAYEEKITEVEALKNSVNKSELFAKNLKKELEIKNKVIRENENLIKKLEHKNESLATNYKNLKTDLNKVKNENRKLLKNRPNSIDHVQTQVTSENLKAEYEEDLNQNTQPTTSSQLSLSSISLRAPPLTPDRKVPSPPSPVTPPPAPAHPSTTPPCTPPGSTSGSTATAARERICLHSPQCTTRSPRPPPPDKCTILVHSGSKYHEYMVSHVGVPHQLGLTHEYCMRIDYENYGCEDCKWFKKWGELHGYPDINPWDFKEHRQPLTY